MSGPSGQYVSVSTGAKAFVPNDLPPQIAWSSELASALSSADRMIGRLAGEGGRLPNPHVLIRPFVRREAVLSSRIEGTQATLGELLAHEAGAPVERSPEDLREVANYVAALEQGVARLAELPLSLRLVRELHETLTRGVRGDRAAPGEFRRIQVWIGPPGATVATARFVPPPPDRIGPCLDAWERFLHERTLPPLVHAALMHYQFEAIHPFLDGNGRVGRLLITLFLIERGVLPSPLLYLSAFFEASRADYYDLLIAVSERSAWREWLLYFLQGVEHQAGDALRRTERINVLLDGWRRDLGSRHTPTMARLLDRLAANPFITITGAVQHLNVAFTTAQRAITVLKDRGIVVQTSAARRDRVFCAQALLDVLEEPTDLAEA
ncbi:MAG TPA: Fic family protein [Burkholderiales bacterium]|nr:Fic family protein [Burkholderiales bacterium]